MRKGKPIKYLSMFLAVMIMLNSLSLIVSAEGTSASTPSGVADFGKGDASIVITQNDSSQSLVGKKFNLYRLFDVENSVDLESVNYTFNSEYKEALQKVVGAKLDKTPADVTEYEVIDYIQTLNNNKVEGAQATQVEEGRYSDFRFFIEELKDEIVSLGKDSDVVTITEVASDGSVTIGGLVYGYYIIDEVTDNQGSHSASSLCMVNTANPEASINIKSDYPTVTKKIQEDDNNVGWNDIGDYEIGQTVPYKFTSNVPNLNGYSEYYYAWHDVMDEELTFNSDSVSITISDDTKSYELKSNEFAITENPGNGDTFMIEIDDIKAIVDREFDQINDLNENVYGQNVVVKYNATLNDKAAKDMGRAGYENDVRLEFSNNPDSDGAEQTGFTPWDTVVCFTYKIDVLKTNDHDQKLEGAKFRLYSDAACTNEVYVKKTEDGYNVINRDSVNGTAAPLEAVEMVSDENGGIIINGVDAGTYYLKETKAPTGYRKLLDAIVLTVDSTFTEERNLYVKGEGATDKTLKALIASAHIKNFLDGVYSEDDVTLDTDVETGAINIKVINTVGTKLPATGSTATLIMLVVGAGLVLFYIFTKKKEEQEDS